MYQLSDVCRLAITLLVLTAVGACQSIADLSSFRLTEQQIEQHLQTELQQLTKKVSVAGIPVTLQIDNVGIQIGPDNTDVIRVASIATAGINVFGFEYPASVRLELQGRPVFNGQQNAVYLRQVRLLDSTVEAGGYKGNLAPISDNFMSLLNQYLENNPVYQLDTSNKMIAVFTQLPLNLQVAPGALTLTPISTSTQTQL